MYKIQVKLGVMAPLSGIVGLYGQEISWAAQIACDEINEQGGVLGHPLELVILDDGSIPQLAVPAAKSLINDHQCVAMVGNLLSNSRIAVNHEVANIFKVPYLNFSFYEGSIFGKYFFSFSALPNQQIDKMIPYMANRFGHKFYFAGSNYEWPRGSIDAAIRVLEACGGERVGEDYLELGTDDFSTLLRRVEKSGADVFVPYFAGSDQLNLLTQLSGMGLKDRVAVVMGHYDEAMVSQLPVDIRQGFFSSNTYFMSVNTEANQHYLDKLAGLSDVTGIWPKGNGVLTNFGEGTYACVKAFATAANKAKSLESEALIEALKTTSVESPQGMLVMDSRSHHAQVNSYLAQCQYDGTFEIIQSFGMIPPVIPELYRSKEEVHSGLRKAEENTAVGNAKGFSKSKIPEWSLLGLIDYIEIEGGGGPQHQLNVRYGELQAETLACVDENVDVVGAVLIPYTNLTMSTTRVGQERHGDD